MIALSTRLLPSAHSTCGVFVQVDDVGPGRTAEALALAHQIAAALIGYFDAHPGRGISRSVRVEALSLGGVVWAERASCESLRTAIANNEDITTRLRAAGAMWR